MRAAATAMILLAVCAAGTGMAAENANGVSFTLNTLRNPAVYRVGEWIELSAAYSATRPGYCLVESGGGLRDQIWRQSQDEFNVVPLDDMGSVGSAMYDPYFDKDDFNPSSIKTISKLSSIHLLSEKPRQVRSILNDWVRIATPGKYRVTGRSGRVFSQCPLESQPPEIPIALQSNEIEITILSAESGWVKSELRKIDKILAFSSDENTKTLAFRRLGYLNTPDSTRELAERFVADTTPNSEATLAQGLLESSWRETAISELDRSLHEKKQVPQSIYHVLAMLLVAREFQDRLLPNEQEPDERQRAIKAREERFSSVLAEFYLLRPNDMQSR
jgi:hypothetical protein